MKCVWCHLPGELFILSDRTQLWKDDIVEYLCESHTVIYGHHYYLKHFNVVFENLVWEG